jgi:hypothetical protein
MKKNISWQNILKECFMDPKPKEQSPAMEQNTTQ